MTGDLFTPSHTHGPRGPEMSDAERVDRVRLAQTPSVGPVTFEALLQRFHSAAQAIEALPALAARGGRKEPVRVPSVRDALRLFDRAAHGGARLLVFGDRDYPAPLAALSPPPPFLMVKGRTDTLAAPAVAMVGARNASALGRQFAATLARELGQQGVTVVSGLARGIDTAAHEGALETGTIAVLAGGLDRIYPPENTPLAEAIAEGGLLMSEMPFGLAPKSQHFPRRNRIVSGLSAGVVVVEAALRSGSLITARHALEQGREVMAVPGFPADPRARGCNRLLRDGASLVESVEDVLEALGPAVRTWPAQTPSDGQGTLGERGRAGPVFHDGSAAQPPADGGDLAAVRAALAPLIGPVPTPVDHLIQMAGVPTDLALTVLMEWDLAGRVTREPGGTVAATASWAP